MRRIVAIGALVVAATLGVEQALAQNLGGGRQIDFNIHDDAAEIAALFPLTMDGAYRGFGVFFNDDSDFVLSGKAHVLGGPAEGFSPLELGAGAKGVIFKSNDTKQTGSALALGGSARFGIMGQIPQAMLFQLHIAPNITSFGRAERYYEGIIRYELEMTQHAAGYLGFRYLRVHMRGGRATFDNGLHIGVTFRF
ncbi:hypothetical protein CKO15_03595 [Halorhodospira abdelmalekii]|uniref:YfaZ family outer membrane protein n=1 Tax=Halorhodospira abdelmalekii TaxID=421629 RepID=UPI0019046ADB|nr:YfaZ family outer membrane protein [Halorhodospira abdelmalekii]MBK1734383.1 hypothetical protein [Halorhodospira abdelmalekii]